MATQVKLNLVVTAIEQLATGLHLASEPQVTALPTGISNKTLDLNSSPPVDSIWYAERTLDGAGEDLLDLTALPRGNFTGARDFTGKKVQGGLIQVLGAAPGIMTFDPPAAASPYLLWGPAGKIRLGKDGLEILHLNETAPDVTATEKEIKVVGTVAGEKYQILLWAS